MVHELTVQDMTCGGCAASVRKAVLQVPGVSEVEIDVPTHLVHVETSDGVTTETITSAINDAGYTQIVLPRQEKASAEHAMALTDANGGSGCSCCS